MEIFKKVILNYRVLSILFLGFSAGIPLAITGSVLSMWLSRLGIDVKTIGLFALVSIPFSFKYLWSSLFDYVPIPYFSKRFGLRRSWLVLTQLCLMLSIIGLGNSSPMDNIKVTAIIALLVSFFSATQDIIIDALRIEILEKEEQGLGATMYVYGYRIAMLVSGAGSLLLADYISWNQVFMIMSLNIFVGIIAVIFLDESQHSIERFKKLNKLNFSFISIINFIKNAKWLYTLVLLLLCYKGVDYLWYNNTAIKIIFFSSILIFSYYKRELFLTLLPEPIADFCKRPKWFYIVLFIIFYKLADTLLVSLQSKFYVTMGFSNTDIAYVTKGFGFIMTLVGLFFGGIIYYKLGVFRSLLVSGILQISSNLLFIWVANQQHDLLALTVTIAVENFTGAIGNVVIVAYLSSLCNIDYTATQYALLSSLSSVGRTLIAAPAGYVVAAVGWKTFFIFTAIAGIPGIILLYLIFNKQYDSKQ